MSLWPQNTTDGFRVSLCLLVGYVALIQSLSFPVFFGCSNDMLGCERRRCHCFGRGFRFSQTLSYSFHPAIVRHLSAECQWQKAVYFSIVLSLTAIIIIMLRRRRYGNIRLNYSHRHRVSKNKKTKINMKWNDTLQCMIQRKFTIIDFTRCWPLCVFLFVHFFFNCNQNIRLTKYHTRLCNSSWKSIFILSIV